MSKYIPMIGGAFAALGAIGSLLEKVGEITKKPALCKIGQRLEAVALDLPKLFGGQ